MARPWVVDGGYSLQILKIAANKFNSSHEQPIRGGPPTGGLGNGLTIPHHKK